MRHRLTRAMASALITNSAGSNPPLEQGPHAVDAATVARLLTVDPSRGLASAEAASRLNRYGANALQTIRPRPAWRILLDQFASLIVALLAVAALIAWATGDVTEAAAIVVVLILNALVGFATEWQAGRALDALRRQAHVTARVRRDGREMKVDAAELVPGDVISRSLNAMSIFPVCQTCCFCGGHSRVIVNGIPVYGPHFAYETALVRHGFYLNQCEGLADRAAETYPFPCRCNCEHATKEEKVGRCLTKITCTKCKQSTAIDSSD